MKPSPCRAAFTFIELCIVITILGLIAGGIFGGQALIRASELRNVTTDLQNYQTALNVFREKYFSIPGDMPNATTFWGKDATNCNAHTGLVGTPGTCNGNNDGMILGASAANSTGEMFQFWKQLSLAELIDGTYTGLAGSGGGYHAVIGTNVPRSKIQGVGASPAYYDAGNGDANNYGINYGNQITIGRGVSSNDSAGAFLTPLELWNMDGKLDDGKPGTGKIISIFWDICSLSANATDLNADYDLQVTTRSCSIRYKDVI